MSKALRALLEGVVDYAGLYPPASLDMPSAARNYHEYRSGKDRWMLGRFVVGVAKLPELRANVASLRGKDPAQEPWPVSVVAPDAAAATAVLRAPDDASVRIESVEVKAGSVNDVMLLGRAAPKNRDVYVEVALDATTPELLDAIARGQLRAKIRTGGVTAEAFPSATDVVSFMRACLARRIPFKATAGLHHPLRGDYRLTYASSAPTGSMYGYLNVFLTAALMSEGMADKPAAALLVESDPAAIVIEDERIRWHDHEIDLAGIREARVRVATSFGSCSFREPVDELPYQVG